MINFKEEILKYEPILEIDDIEGAIHANELQDMFDMLQYISKQNSLNNSEYKGDDRQTFIDKE